MMVIALAGIVGWVIIGVAIWLSQSVSPRRHEDGRGLVVFVKVAAAWLLFPIALVVSIVAIPILWPKRRRIRAEEADWLRGAESPAVDTWLASKRPTDA